MNRTDKPKKTPAELVVKLKEEKGVTFNIISEAEAEKYLVNKNNYLRTASYRKNYQKYERGENQGKYIGLDFAYLMDLSSIDMHLRDIIIRMCIDIEHDLKMQMLRDVDNDNIDGYELVEKFLDADDYLKNSIIKKQSSSYTYNLIQKYFVIDKNKEGKQYIKVIDCPIWVLLELLTFGEFITLYIHYYGEGKLPIKKNLLNSVKSLRNACAHNNCLIQNLNKGDSKPSAQIRRAVEKVKNITSTQKNERLSVRFVLEFVSMLYVYNQIVSCDVKTNRIAELNKLFDERMVKNKIYYENNAIITNTYLFLNSIIKGWFC